MYSLLYKLYFGLKRIEWEKWLDGERCPKYLKKILGYIEWYYNIPVARLFKKFPSKKYGLAKQQSDKKIVVSLTSFPDRIDTVWLTIETLLRQTKKPDAIILWLAKEQFSGIDSLPQSLLQLQKRGLSIRFCDDIRSHKKYYYTMKEYPNDIVILVDDDTFYSLDMIEKLYELHLANPNEIVCMTPTMISSYDELPSRWRRPGPYSKVEHSYKAQPYSGQGTLYPPHCMDEQYLFNKELMMRLCPYADDLWLKFMSLRKGTKVSAVYRLRSMPVAIDGTARSGLWHINGGDGGNKNDEQWKSLVDYFGVNDFLSENK